MTGAKRLILKNKVWLWGFAAGNSRHRFISVLVGSSVDSQRFGRFLSGALG